MTEKTADETITFTIEKDEKLGFIVRTGKNPYIMVQRFTKLEAVAIAFTRYLERLNDIEYPKIAEEEPKKYTYEGEESLAIEDLGEDSGN